MFLYAFVKGLKGVLSKKAYGEKYSMAVWALQILPYLILSYLLILLLFAASKRGKLLKTTEECSVHKNSEFVWTLRQNSKRLFST